MTQMTIAQQASTQVNTSLNFAPARKHVNVPEGLWLACPGCSQMIFRKEMEAKFHTCPGCKHHFRVSARQRIAMLADDGSFEEMDAQLSPTDQLCFSAKKAYRQQLAEAQKLTGSKDGVLTGRAFVKGRPIILAAMDFTFLAGSMGAVVGEKITRAVERATAEHLPIVIISCSGGARMQESTISLMQMAKTSGALARHHRHGGLFVSVLADPTTGGVTASFAMLGDLIIAEPKAMIGFAGPRTIANTIRMELPEGFQRAEFLLSKGFIDRIVPRSDLRSALARSVDFFGR
ncbi:MAG: acetyl-CoA carboxylase, carboxyltransferase subunit beta [Phycisphaerae bacterium]